MVLSENDLQICFHTALGLVKEAGLHVSKAFHSMKSVTLKTGDIDLVTETDHFVEALIKDALKAKFPSHKFIGEESGQDKPGLTDDPTWILDPIDGTMNFVHTYPSTCVSLALWVDKDPEIGVIYNPITQELYAAQRRRGATLNGFPIRVSTQMDLTKSLIITETGTSRDEAKMNVVKANIATLLPKVHGFRMTGAAALDLALIARGAAEVYYEFGLHIWDMAAATVIIREAGGVVVDTSGGPFDPMSRRIIAAANHELVNQIAPMLRQIELERD
ncbi:unnamed protein product [Cyprideis torosa]|uniref:Inositol-1-monophosphatase n=1 Tax=Cyprideis torosa TaxID=163714 RepID=A0A7R8WCT0_9CRUS|nr:unnamed protein product [Cyprideis torosa]CAG0887648.1 unnamed protein product [Cyprideis torosa]